MAWLSVLILPEPGVGGPDERAITGIVVDPANVPINGAVVELLQVRSGNDDRVVLTANTDVAGVFRLKPPASRYKTKVKISAAGFLVTTVSVPKLRGMSKADLGKIRLGVSCSTPGVICDELRP